MNTLKIKEDAIVREPLYEKLRKKLIELIETTELNYLPNEKELMQRYKVSRNTLRRAIQELTRENILQPIQGIGTLVHPAPGVGRNSKLLLLCDHTIPAYQQEVFNQLLFMLGKSCFDVNVFMMNKDDFDPDMLARRLRDCDAVVVDWYCSYSSALVEQVAQSGKKRVCLRWDATPHGLSSVEMDVELGFRRITEHLLDLGHRHLAFLGFWDDEKRKNGICRALSERGLDAADLIVLNQKVEHARLGGYALTEQLVSAHPECTAIIAHSDSLALGVQEYLLQHGIAIPERMSVAGFDNLGESAHYPVPLTTCSGNLDDLIHEAIGYLFSSKKPGELFYRKLAPEVVIRESTAPPRP